MCIRARLNGLTVEDAKEKIISWLSEKGRGRAKVNFKLRDLVFSRQRYWGCLLYTSRLGQLKAKIKAMGNVNVAAIEEYKEVAQRYEFMKKQTDDVEKSRTEILHLIGDLTRCV